MKCDELKAFDVGLGQYTENGYPCVVAFDADQNPRLLGDEKVYLKSEADKVIADLEESHKKEVGQLLIEIAELSKRIADGDKDFEMADHQNQRLLKIVRHHKYKRCLAMAKWCMAIYNEWAAYYPTTTTRKMKFLDKWHKRWREIAEKFKEAK